MTNRPTEHYEVFRQIAMLAGKGTALNEVATAALRQASDLVGLAAASLVVWKEGGEISLSVTHAESELSSARLQEMERELFRTLRTQKKLSRAWLSFDTDPPTHSFTVPLVFNKKTFGAVIGLLIGETSPIAENGFVDALSAFLGLYVAAVEASTGGGAELIEQEKLQAVLQTAVTVNHEVNNPLTAILGNAQLLLMKRTDLDDELRAKLKTIEASALKIRDVTQKLLRLRKVRSIEYTEGTSMLDLSDDEKG